MHVAPPADEPERHEVTPLVVGAALGPAAVGDGQAVVLRAGLPQPDPSTGTGFCGMPLLGALLLSLAACFVLSLFALIIGTMGYLRLDPPRSLSRRLELCVIGLPAFLMLAIARASAILEQAPERNCATHVNPHWRRWFRGKQEDSPDAAIP